MRFKIDENLPIETAQILRSAGHDAMTVAEQAMAGRPDLQIVEVCKREDRILITFDLDFSDVRAYAPFESCGLIVFRLRKQDKITVLNTLRRLMPLFETERIDQRLWIVEENRLRVHGDD